MIHIAEICRRISDSRSAAVEAVNLNLCLKITGQIEIVTDDASSIVHHSLVLQECGPMKRCDSSMFLSVLLIRQQCKLRDTVTSQKRLSRESCMTFSAERSNIRF